MSVIRRLRRVLRAVQNAPMRWPGLYSIEDDVSDVVRKMEGANSTGEPVRWRPVSEPVDTGRAAIHFGLVLAYAPGTGELGALEPHAFQGVTLAPVSEGAIEWWAYLDDISLPVRPATGIVHGVGFRPEYCDPELLERIKREQREED